MNESELKELLQILQGKLLPISAFIKPEVLQKSVQDVEKQMNEPDFWENPTEAQQITKVFSEKKRLLTNFLSLKEGLEAIDMFLAEGEDNIDELAEEAQKLQILAEKLEEEQLFSGEYDHADAILALKVGNGGQDAEDFTQMLLRMYLRFCEKQGFTAEMMEKSDSDAGIRSATVRITGQKAYGFLKSEHGVQRLIRLSPFNAKSLRQTSFARVEILPDLPTEDDITIPEADLRIDVFRSSGAGGQSVNTTDSAVRITYLPLNLVVTCQNEKSQQQNKESAMKVLRARIRQAKEAQKAEELSDLRGDIMENSFGSQIRTFTLQPYKLVKDHRTDFESGSPEKVLDGGLLGFMKAFLQKQSVA